MKSYTFDWNCVIAVEEDQPQAPFVRELVELHRAKRINVGITTVSASETLRGSKSLPASGALFHARLHALGWGDLDQILGPAVPGLAYIGLCHIVNDSFEAEVSSIWNVVGGNVSETLPEQLSEAELQGPAYKKWRNVWCDVHTLWTHIDADRDVFVTSNTKDFQKNEAALRKLGLRAVMTPEEAVKANHGS